MPVLDVKTLFYIWSLGCFLTIFTFMIYSFSYKVKSSSFYIYVSSKLFQGFAFYMFASRSPVASSFSIYLSNLFLLIGFANEIYSLKNVLYKFHLKYFTFFNGTSMTMMFFYSFILNKSGNYRVIVMSIFIGIISLSGSIFFFSIKSKNNFQILNTLFLFAISISMFIRALNAYYSKDLMIFDAGFVQICIYLSFFIITYLLPIIFILYLKDKDLQKIEEYVERYHSLITISNTGAWEFYPEKNLLWCSSEYFSMLGLKPDKKIPASEFYQKFWLDLLHPNDYLRVTNALDSFVLASDDTLFDNIYRMKHADGHWIWIKTRGKKLFNENNHSIIKIIGTNFDITESKIKEEALLNAIRTAKENENYALAFIMQSPISIQVFDKEGYTITVNDAWKKLWLNSKTMNSENYNILKDQELKSIGWEQYLTRAFLGESILFPIFEYNPNNNYQFGEKKTLSCLSFPIMENNEVRRIVMMHEDITDQKKAEEEIITTNLNLEKARIEATKLAIEAKKASQAKSEFLANMSHEIRTPLNSVVGFLSLLAESDLNKDQKQYMENAKTSSNALMEVVNDILDFTKIEAGKLEIDEIPTNLPLLIEDVSDIIKFHADKNGLNFLLKIPVNCPTLVKVDPIRLKQIILNLMNNAVKFTAEGEVELALDFTPDQNNPQFGTFKFFIRDTGIGISPEQKGKLFQAFAQADSSTTRKFGGTGLGLIISSNLIKLMGSELNLVSGLNQGCLFCFSLNKEIITYSDIPQINHNDQKKALIIESIGFDSITLYNNLSQFGISADIVSLKKLPAVWDTNSAQYHYLFLDYKVESISCLEILNSMFAFNNEKDPSLKIVIVQRTTDKALKNEDLNKYHIHTVLNKPIKPSKLNQLIFSIEDKKNNHISDQSIINFNKNIKILIAEDVKMNRTLLISILKKMLPNVQIFEASNGLDAINAYQYHKPDLIIMDVQMPEVDGYTATKRIRSLEVNNTHKIPILALTAGVIQGDKEKCLESGMTDYLNKPIEPSVITDMIIKYLKDSLSTHINNENEENENMHFNENKFLIRCGNDPEFCHEIKSLGVIQLKSDISVLKNAILEKNLSQIVSLAHKIKGTAVNLSAEKLALFALFIEKNSTQDFSLINSYLQKIENEIIYLNTLFNT